MKKPNHFLDLDSFDKSTLRKILNAAARLKKERKKGNLKKYLADKKLAMIFEKPSTRTRVSFEAGIIELGGSAISLNHTDIQLGRGESVADTARVLSRYVDMIMIRCFHHQTLLEMAKNSSIPVINGLTDYSHPCQIMADILTFEERKGDIGKKVITWIGDSNNVTTSWIHAACLLGFEFRISSPETMLPAAEIMRWAEAHGGNAKIYSDMHVALKNSDCIVTDCWLSMGQEENLGETATRKKTEDLKPFQVNEDVMRLAKKDAIFMHCLPAHRGEEVTASVIDGPQSAIWDEAENRLHAQKAVMLWCLGEK